MYEYFQVRLCFLAALVIGLVGLGQLLTRATGLLLVLRHHRVLCGLANQRDRLVRATLQDFVRQLAVGDSTGEL
jgi:hypothetical protein